MDTTCETLVKPPALLDCIGASFDGLAPRLLDSFIEDGYYVRRATIDDIVAIDEFIALRYGPEVAREISNYESYRCVRYGSVLLVEDDNKDIAACQYEIPYGSVKMVSYAFRLMVRADLEGQDIAKRLFMLLCMESVLKGSLAQHSIVSMTNDAVHCFLLNQMGAVYETLIQQQLLGVKDHFSSSLRLSEGNLFAKVTMASYQRFAGMNSGATSHFLLPTNDKTAIARALDRGTHVISAYIPGKWVAQYGAQFLFTEKAAWDLAETCS